VSNLLFSVNPNDMIFVAIKWRRGEVMSIRKHPILEAIRTS